MGQIGKGIFVNSIQYLLKWVKVVFVLWFDIPSWQLNSALEPKVLPSYFTQFVLPGPTVMGWHSKTKEREKKIKMFHSWSPHEDRYLPSLWGANWERNLQNMDFHKNKFWDLSHPFCILAKVWQILSIYLKSYTIRMSGENKLQDR